MRVEQPGATGRPAQFIAPRAPPLSANAAQVARKSPNSASDRSGRIADSIGGGPKDATCASARLALRTASPARRRHGTVRGPVHPARHPSIVNRKAYCLGRWLRSPGVRWKSHARRPSALRATVRALRPQGIKPCAPCETPRARITKRQPPRTGIARNDRTLAAAKRNAPGTRRIALSAEPGTWKPRLSGPRVELRRLRAGSVERRVKSGVSHETPRPPSPAGKTRRAGLDPPSARQGSRHSRLALIARRISRGLAQPDGIH